MKNCIISLVVILVIGLLGGIGFIYSGIFNVAATSKDPALLSWAIVTTREHSIESRSSNITAPANVLQDPKKVLEGFSHYNEMCVVCHGAPGLEAGEARKGLNPEPPLLAKLKDIQDDPPGELFWILKNGIKMTAMPAWGPTHSDEKIWAMVAFIRKLPSMTANEYQAMKKQAAAAGLDHDDD